MTDQQIKHMVDRFLTWRLPADFDPDGGISFEPTYKGINNIPIKREPVGTNLLTAAQAEAMVRHMLDGLPTAAPQPAPVVGEVEAAVLAERERIASALDAEAETTPDPEDAKVVRDCALLVRADFSYDGAESLAAALAGEGK